MSNTDRLFSWATKHKWESGGEGNERGAGKRYFKVPGGSKGVLIPATGDGIEQILTRQKTYPQIKTLLAQNRDKIHPIFQFGSIHAKEGKPYLVTKHIPEKTGSENSCACLQLQQIIQTQLGQVLGQIGVLSNATIPFDLQNSNIMYENFHPDDFEEEIHRVNFSGDNDNINRLFQKIHQLGGRIWLFDYGLWNLPEEK